MGGREGGEKGEPEGWAAHTGSSLEMPGSGVAGRGDGEDRFDGYSQALGPGLGARVASRRGPRTLGGRMGVGGAVLKEEEQIWGGALPRVILHMVSMKCPGNIQEEPLNE